MMRGRLFAGRLFAGRLFGAQASPEIDATDNIIRHYGGGMNGAVTRPATEIIRPRRIEHQISMDDDDDLLAMVAVMVMTIGA